MQILGVGVSYPGHRVSQRTITETLGKLWIDAGYAPTAVDRFHRATAVETRHLCLPADAYTAQRTFAEANGTFIAAATDLAAIAVRRALSHARFEATDVGFLVVVSTTGVASPSIDARLVPRMGLPRDIRRLPIVGLGCAGGAAGLARAAELVGGGGISRVALVVCVELCSLTFQLRDTSTANLVATGLFGDAAACAVVGAVPARRAGTPRIVATRSVLLPDTEKTLGFDIGESGFKLVLGVDLPHMASRALQSEVDALLAEQGLVRDDVGTWIVHPGGPKILRAVERTLCLSAFALRPSWECLRRIGNVSSASVLCILNDMLAEPPPAGTYGVLIGMGPGFSVETILLRWQ